MDFQPWVIFITQCAKMCQAIKGLFKSSNNPKNGSNAEPEQHVSITAGDNATIVVAGRDSRLTNNEATSDSSQKHDAVHSSIHPSDRTRGLEVLSGTANSLESLCLYVKNRHGYPSPNIIRSAQQALGNLRDFLEPIDPSRAEILQNVKAELGRTFKMEIRQQNTPIVHALGRLDPAWRDKHPEDFEVLHEIRSIILKL